MSVKQVACALTTASIFTVGLATNAQAASLISNGTIQLGVDNLGQLNIPGGAPSSGSGTRVVGLRFLPTGAEATAPGCLCEGWGIADAATGVTGYANNAIGTAGLSLLSFTSTATEATAVVDVGSTFRVTHNYAPVAETPYLYRDLVTIENIGTTSVADLRFRRVMDWDIEPTAFKEYVTIAGTAASSKVLFASNNGFASSNPLSGQTSLGYTGDFVDAGPGDHGALFDFGFGALAAGAKMQFSTFYGGAPTEAEALKALADVKAEVYSFGQPGTATGKDTGAPNTFIFAFAGVGGKPVTVVPEPASTLGLLALGAMGAGSMLKRKQQQKATVKA